jgi:hypothetical protein
MSWLKVVLTRVVVGEIVRVVLWLVAPSVKVDHFLVILIVFLVATAFGVVPGSSGESG